MTVLVTGAAGLIGRFVVKELAESGEDVVSADITRPAAIRKRETYERVDIGDPMAWTQLISQYKPDRIIHLSALITHLSHARPLEALRVNVMGTGYMLEAARLLGMPRIVYASSVLVYGAPSVYEESMVDEDSLPAPNTIYGSTKLMNEAIAAHYRKAYGMRITGLRPIMAYGPKRYEGVLANLNCAIRDAVMGRPVHWSRAFAPDVVHSPLHVVDMARAFVRAATGSFLPSPVYNVGGAENLSEDDMLRIILEAVPQHGPVIHEPDSKMLVSFMRADVSRFHRDANFVPQLTMSDAVAWSNKYYNDPDFRHNVTGGAD